MGNYLNCRAKIFATSFLVKNIPINLTCCEVRIFVQVLVDKPFVMSEVEVGFSTVLGNVNLAVLIRAHSARVNIDIRVKLLRSNL